MAITIHITDKEINASGLDPASLGTVSDSKEVPKEDEIKISFGKRFVKIKLHIRKTLDNNIVIFDHPVMDIIVIPSKNKIFTIPKDNSNTDSYPSQDRYFKFLDKKGILIKGTIRCGSILSSLEAFYPPNSKIDVLQVILLVTKRFLDKENEFIHISQEYDEDVNDMYSDPDEKDTTELGEVPQSATKGKMNMYQSQYGILYSI